MDENSSHRYRLFFGKIFCCHGVAPGLVVIWMNVNSVHCFNTHCDSVDILHEECFAVCG